MITTLDLDAIEARAAAATPGEWRVSGEHRDQIIQTNHITRDVWHIPRRLEDIEFIAHARTDVPALLAEVRRLRLIVVDYQLGTICRLCHSRPCRCDVGAKP